MDSSYKGYGKVNGNSLEDQSLPRHKPANRKLLLAAVSLIVLLTVVVGAVVGVLIRKPNSEPPVSQSSPASISESIRAVCSVTEFPLSCFDSISSVNNVGFSEPDPELIFNISLSVAVNELKNLSSVPKKMLMSKSNDARTESALKDCLSLFDNALSQLNSSMELMEVGPGEKVLTEEKIGDMKSWISAAMTDQETCLDGLVEVESSVTDKVRGELEKSKEYMSNSLAILSNIQVVLDKFNLKMH